MGTFGSIAFLAFVVFAVLLAYKIGVKTGRKNK